jgi:preprotein translocase subunit SecE
MGRGRNVLAKVNHFLIDVRSELKKVTWPTRKETISTTWIVVLIILLISFYLGLCDAILAKVIRALLG